MEGWIKLHRQITKWEWYDDANTFRLFIHLLLTANHEDNSWHGVEIKTGEVLTGRKILAKKLKLSEQNIRTSLNHLKSTNEVTITTTKLYSIIKLNNWCSYQQPNQEANQQLTKDQPSTNQGLTTNKKVKKVRMKETNIYTSSFNSFWNDYPIKVGKRKAFSIWKQRGLSKYLPEMLAFISSAVKSKQWADGFIPHPATFLNGNRWEDDLGSLGKQREVVSVR